MAPSPAPLSPVDPNQVYALVRSCADQSDYIRYQRDQKTLTELFAHPGKFAHNQTSVEPLTFRMLPGTSGNCRQQVVAKGRETFGIHDHCQRAQDEVEEQDVRAHGEKIS